MVELGRQLIDEARGLVRKEIELAKVELIELVKTNAIAAGMFVGAAILALIMFIMLQVAFIVTILVTLGRDAGFYLAWSLFGFWLVLVVVLALIGKSKLKFKPPEKTIATLKGDIEWAKGQIHSNGKS
jgi:putative superfamily III holin-X